ncbi:MAG TPA: hypothetical protein VIX63_14545 [Vicinamibacterales bacterium]
MSEKTGPAHEVAGASPPGRGEQTHQVMQADASRPVAGPAGSQTLAAGGGLEVPGREAHPYAVEHETLLHEPIPGERDPETLTSREPGGIGTLSGAGLPRVDARTWLTEEDIEELQREGGGSQRKRKR